MSAIIPFESGKLPAYLSAGQKLGNIISTGGGGFPVVSIKGKVFTVRRGSERNMLMDPDRPDAPAPYIDVVILNSNTGLAKIYYEANYAEGSDEKPLCYSNDGVNPAKDAQEPQATKCATCAHNQWGSRITESGAKAKECQDSKRLAIATPTAVGDAMLLRVPAASLKALGQYIKLLESRGVDNYQAVVTRIGFDYSVAHPALTFKPVGFVDEATFADVVEAVQSDVVGQIIGTVEIPRDDDDAGETVVEAPKPRKAAQPAVEKPAAPAAPAKTAPKAAPAPAPEDDDEPKPRVKVKVEGDDEVEQAAPAAPAKPAPKKAAAAPVVVDDMDDGLDQALENIEWDD
jgi:hypothetical protein